MKIPPPRNPTNAHEMDLRDRIAMAILQGYAANSNEDQGLTTLEVLTAYQRADECLDVRLGITPGPYDGPVDADAPPASE